MLETSLWKTTSRKIKVHLSSLSKALVKHSGTWKTWVKITWYITKCVAPYQQSFEWFKSQVRVKILKDLKWSVIKRASWKYCWVAFIWKVTLGMIACRAGVILASECSVLFESYGRRLEREGWIRKRMGGFRDYLSTHFGFRTKC